MTVTVSYFAWVREQVGIGEEQVERPGDVRTAGDLARHLAARGGGYAGALGDPARIRVAVDLAMTGMDASIEAAREIAFFPPVTGG